MSETRPSKRKLTAPWLLGLGILLLGLIVGCGASAPAEQTGGGEAAQPQAAAQPELAKPQALQIAPTAAPAEPAAPSASEATVPSGSSSASASTTTSTAPAASGSAPAAPTAVPAPAVAWPDVTSARDSVIFVTNEEPTTIGAASANCGGNIQNTICDDMASDPLTWIDDQQDFQVVGLTGIESWEQIGADRWRFYLREGVTFHNGAPLGTPSKPSSGSTTSATKRPAGTTTPTTSASTESSGERWWTT